MVVGSGEVVMACAAPGWQKMPFNRAVDIHYYHELNKGLHFNALWEADLSVVGVIRAHKSRSHQGLPGD